LLTWLNVRDGHVSRHVRLHGRPFALRVNLAEVQLLFHRPRVVTVVHTCGRGCSNAQASNTDCSCAGVDDLEKEEEEVDNDDTSEWAALLASLKFERRGVEVDPGPPSIRHYNSSLLSRCRASFAAGVGGLYHGSAAVGHKGAVAGFDTGRIIALAGTSFQLVTKVCMWCACGVDVVWMLRACGVDVLAARGVWMSRACCGVCMLRACCVHVACMLRACRGCTRGAQSAW
jgi:hypothetical protein